MTTLGLAVGGLGAAGSLIWFALLVHLIRHRDLAVFLARLDDSPPAGGWPEVAVIFAARDEAAGVETAARSMLALDYPGLEVIAVDDRSVDATGAILDRLALDPAGSRLRVVHVRDLPGDWLGKTHALQRGSERTSARWLLFTDADVEFQPGALRRAIRFAESEKLDHMTVLPEMPNETIPERMFLAIFGLFAGLACPIGRIGRRDSRVHMGVGAFNLVRGTAFRDVGGFRQIALSVDDDLMLAKVIKFAGYHSRAVLGVDAVSVRWQVGLGGMVRGLEKNAFAILRFRFLRVAVAFCGVFTLGIAPYLAVALAPWPLALVSAGGILTLAVLLGGTSGHSRIGWPYAGLIPLAACAILFTILRSTALTLARGGVIWRGHLYPIRILKDHVRHRDAWFRELWLSTR